MLTFRKVHGAGNDFILFADPAADRDWPEEARRLCSRGTGIGADGLVVTTRLGPAAFEVRCFNADGSTATMCGNALRCAAFCAARDHAGQVMSLVMADTEHRAQVRGDDVAVTADAGPVLPRQIQVTWNGKDLAFDTVHTGTEHVVAIVDDVDDIDVPGCGRLVRRHPSLAPLGSNVNFVQVTSAQAVRIRTYERGVEAETLSCASGAVAAAVVTRVRCLTRPGPLTVHNHAGTALDVRPDPAGPPGAAIWVSAPVAVVFQGRDLMAAVIDPADRAFLTSQIRDLRRWAERSAGQLTVALVYGGVSEEDQFYIAKSPPELLSVTALSGLGMRFSVLDPCRPDFIQDLAGFDVALPNLHGPFGEDGRLQGLLDYLRTPCCGSGVAASALAADKVLCKQMMEALGIPTPAWRIWPGCRTAWPGRPVMVKPRMGGSSVGMSLARDTAALHAAAGLAETGDPPGVLIEDYIPGLPVTVGLLELPGGVLVFPPLATRVDAAEFYDAATKLGSGGGTVWYGHAALPGPALTAVTTHALALWDGLGCRGMARADFIVTEPGDVFALEMNTTPGMSHDSNFITAAGLCGLRPADVVAAILHEALTRPRYDAPLPVPAFTTRPDRKSASC